MTIKTIKHLKTKTEYALKTTYTLYAALIGLLSFWNLSRESGPSLVVWAIQVTPLLIFLPGMAIQHYRTYSWLCFVLLLYFILAVQNALMSTSNMLDYVFLTLVVLLFIASMMTSRWVQYSTKTQQV